LKVLFSKIDADGSGDLDIQEIRDALQDDEIRRAMGVTKDGAEAVFGKMDDDSSGVVRWEEFRDWFSTKTDLGALL